VSSAGNEPRDRNFESELSKLHGKSRFRMNLGLVITGVICCKITG
jgi:hypothetical protein